MMVEERAVVAVADGGGEVRALVPLLAEPLVDQHVGVDRHAEHEHEAGQAGQRERGVHRDHEPDREQQVGEQRDARDHAGEAVVEDHEHQHGDERHPDGHRPLADRVGPERRPDGVLADRLLAQLGRQRPAPQDLHEPIDASCVSNLPVICPWLVISPLKRRARRRSGRRAGWRGCGSWLPDGLLRAGDLAELLGPGPVEREIDRTG